jgi:hypothetical protein
MRIFCVFFLSLSLFLVPSLGYTSDLIVWEGKQGYFFDEEAGTKLLKDLEEFNLQKPRISLLEDKLVLREEKIALLELEVTIVDEIASKYKDTYVLEHKLRIADQKHYEEIIKKKDAWYRSPVLWFGVGFVVASAACIALTFGLQEAKE